MGKCTLLISLRATKDCNRFGPDCKYEREIVPPFGFSDGNYFLLLFQFKIFILETRGIYLLKSKMFERELGKGQRRKKEYNRVI